LSLTFGSLFAGIGGVDLGLERAGLECRWQVEIDEFARKVLAKHWPDVRRHDDVRTFPPPEGDWNVDLIAGGFPCQDISFAGRGAGLAGERSGLWFEFARVIRDLRPRYVLVENVPALLVRGMGDVLGTLASLGYDAEWDCLSASSFGSPHQRERVFLIAYPSEIVSDGFVMPDELDGIQGNIEWNATQDIRSGKGWRSWIGSACKAVDGPVSERDFCRMDDGISEELDRIGAVGNAVVPQVAQWIGRRIVEHHERTLLSTDAR